VVGTGARRVDGPVRRGNRNFDPDEYGEEEEWAGGGGGDAAELTEELFDPRAVDRDEEDEPRL